MNVEQYNGYWIASDQYLNQQHRDENAKLIWDYLTNLGWTPQSVAGILGNMDVESTMNPALIEGRGYSALPDNNTVLAITTQTGVGLVQWTGTTPTNPPGQKLASFAIRYNKNWYDGELQCFRLEREYDTDIQFDHGTVDGVSYDWQVYTTSTETPEQLAKVWQTLYERGGTDTQTRQQKARYYYDLFKRISIPLLLFAFNKRKELKPPCRRI
jgi:hypothetical protein